jgi:hypothetical protein
VTCQTGVLLCHAGLLMTLPRCPNAPRSVEHAAPGTPPGRL